MWAGAGWGEEGSCPAPQGVLEGRSGPGGRGRGSCGRQAGGRRLPLHPPARGVAPVPAPHVSAAVPAPARKRRGFLRLGRGYRRPRPGPAQRRRPCSPVRRTMASLGAERSGPGLRGTRAGRPAAALRLLLLLGAILKPHVSLAQLQSTPGSWESEGRIEEENYEKIAQLCWMLYKDHMSSIEKDWCDWAMIRRPYSDLRYCLEHYAEKHGLGFPNPWAEQIIFETHQIHFANCSMGQLTFSDPPEDVLLAMIIAPICLIPFLVTLVVWRSKDSEAQA